jgi:penicillin V acylase-like amidase (Ntn superfamily)
MKKLVALMLLALYAPFGFACTTFLLSKEGKYFFGRNYDWVTGNGIVLVNARGLQKTSLKAEGGKMLNWVSQFGSVTFNQYGKENPTGGMNEKGLVVELMWLQEARYPGKDSRPALDVLQWIQYQLDCSESVEDVIATDRLLRIASSGNAPLHYLVADARGAAATIEFLDGRMVVHKGPDLPYPVLANTVYSEALERTAPASQQALKPFNDNSLARFATACSMVARFRDPATKAAPVDYAFSILNKVAQGDFTKWSIVYDINDRSLYFTTHDHKERKTLSLSGIDFSCSAPLRAFPLESPKSGDIASALAPLDASTHRAILEKSVKESNAYVQLSKDEVDKVAGYFAQPSCIVK